MTDKKACTIVDSVAVNRESCDFFLSRTEACSLPLHPMAISE
jgi:hypothetical protein